MTLENAVRHFQVLRNGNIDSDRDHLSLLEHPPGQS
jgi:hypothetical protein